MLRRSALPLLLTTSLLGCGARTDLALAGSGSSASGSPEICNGVDDDGDGAIDEGIAPIRCGVGACAREVPGCADGAVPACEPGAPSPEICNGLDDDCNGTADDGLQFGPVAGPYTILESSLTNYVFETALVPAGDGMLALMRRDWNQGASTLIARRLDSDGVPAAPEQLLPLASSQWGPNAVASIDDTVVLTYCGRSGTDDITMTARLDQNGSVLTADLPVAPTGRSCGAMTPGVHYTGQQHLFGWIDNSGGPPTPTFEVLLGVHDPKLAPISGDEIEPEGDLVAPPRFAQNGNSVGMVYGLRREPMLQVSEIAFQRLTPSGDRVGERTIVGVPAEMPDASWAQVSLGVNDAGFLVLGANRFDPGVFRARFAHDGSVLEAPTVVAGLDGFFQPMTMATRPTGGFVGAGYSTTNSAARGRVFLLDANGELMWDWSGEPSDDIGAPSIYATASGRVFVLYAAYPEAGYTVRLREFGCVP